MKTLEQKMQELSPERQKKIKARAAQLIREEMTLRDLRLALHQTQKTVAHKLKLGQEGVCRLEQRSDLLLSTLRKYLEAMGGHLVIVAEFPDRNVEISGLCDFADRSDYHKTKHHAARAGARP